MDGLTVLPLQNRQAIGRVAAQGCGASSLIVGNSYFNRKRIKLKFAKEGLGNNRYQSQQRTLELRLYSEQGFGGARHLRC
jgi:hypothetical protein